MHYLTAKITNVPALGKVLGQHESNYLVRRALTRIARDIRLSAGRVVKTTATRVIGEFPSREEAENLACRVDAAINEIPVARGLRIASDVFVASRDKAEIWRSTCMDYLETPPEIRSSLGVPVSALVRYEGRVVSLGPDNPAISIGRDGSNGIVVLHPWVSRNHARILWSAGAVEVVDMSSNGTFVRVHGAGDDVQVERSGRRLDGNAMLSFGLPFAVANGKPVRAEVELIF